MIDICGYMYVFVRQVVFLALMFVIKVLASLSQAFEYSFFSLDTPAIPHGFPQFVYLS
jgi:hypothetical protein